MTRAFTASLAVLGLAAMIVFDLVFAPPNPYRAPAVLAFGSGTAASGGFCAALPN